LSPMKRTSVTFLKIRLSPCSRWSRALLCKSLMPPPWSKTPSFRFKTQPPCSSVLLRSAFALASTPSPCLPPPLSGTTGRWSFVVMLLPCLHFLGVALVDWSRDVTPLLQALIRSLHVAPLGLAWSWSSLSRLSRLRSSHWYGLHVELRVGGVMGGVRLAAQCYGSTFFPSFKPHCKSSKKLERCPPFPVHRCARRPPMFLGSLLLSVGRPRCRE
jgi:hypothetical protein